jgi:hypothetical protein
MTLARRHEYNSDEYMDFSDSGGDAGLAFGKHVLSSSAEAAHARFP